MSCSGVSKFHSCTAPFEFEIVISVLMSCTSQYGVHLFLCNYFMFYEKCLSPAYFVVCHQFAQSVVMTVCCVFASKLKIATKWSLEFSEMKHFDTVY